MQRYIDVFGQRDNCYLHIVYQLTSDTHQIERIVAWAHSLNIILISMIVVVPLDDKGSV